MGVWWALYREDAQSEYDDEPLSLMNDEKTAKSQCEWLMHFGPPRYVVKPVTIQIDPLGQDWWAKREAALEQRAEMAERERDAARLDAEANGTIIGRLLEKLTRVRAEANRLEDERNEARAEIERLRQRDHVDDMIDTWHARETELTLREFLGLTLEEYGRWVETRVYPEGPCRCVECLRQLTQRGQLRARPDGRNGEETTP